MQSDIVQRLRQPWFTHGCAEYQLEAAAEIERNRAEIERLRGKLREIQDNGDVRSNAIATAALKGPSHDAG